MSPRARSLTLEFSKAAGFILGAAVVIGGAFTAVAHGVDAGAPEMLRFGGMGGIFGLILGGLGYAKNRAGRAL